MDELDPQTQPSAGWSYPQLAVPDEIAEPQEPAAEVPTVEAPVTPAEPSDTAPE
jgi:hypothetical protein